MNSWGLTIAIIAEKSFKKVNHSRCCAIAMILWSRSRLPEISKLKKKSETVTLSQLKLLQAEEARITTFHRC